MHLDEDKRHASESLAYNNKTHVYYDALVQCVRLDVGLSDGKIVKIAFSRNSPIAAALETAIALREFGRKRPPSLRVLRLFGFILDQETRERVLQPAYEDINAQHISSLEHRGKWERRWLRFAFSVRTVLLILDCCRVMVIHRVLRPILEIRSAIRELLS